MESPLENQNKNETEMDLNHEVHNVKHVKKTKKRYLVLKILLFLLCYSFLVAIISGALFFYQHFYQYLPKGSGSKEPVGQTRPIAKGTPIVIYAEEVDVIGGNNSRSWPIMNIMRKVGDLEPEFLIKIGSVGEYPDSYLLSTKKDFLLINLESKIIKLDLETKEITDVFTPKKQVLGMVFSPDNENLFIWDQKYVSETDNEYYAHILDLNTKKDNIIKRGFDEATYYPTVWREDDIILLNQPGGEIIFSYYFDLNSKALSETPGGMGVFFPSDDGRVIATFREGVSNICDEFSGSSFSTFSLKDPLTGEEKGSFGQSDKMSKIVELSSDYKQVIYVASNPWTSKDDCEKEEDKGYYLEEIATNKIKILDNFIDILKLWGSNNVGASVEDGLRSDNPSEESSILVIGTKEILRSKSIRIVAQYFY